MNTIIPITEQQGMDFYADICRDVGQQDGSGVVTVDVMDVENTLHSMRWSIPEIKFINLHSTAREGRVFC